MDLLKVAQKYFDAWNQRDPVAIVRTFVEGGTYTDPASGGTLVGEAVGQYAAGLFAAFPNLSFEVISAGLAGENLVAAQWIMRGTNAGPFLGVPPTGRNVELPGADFITVERDKIRSVTGYFDQKNFVEQLGFQAIVQPYSLGPLSFGTCLYMDSGKSKKPGAFSLTWIEVRSDAEGSEVEQRTQGILEELAQTPGFISTVLTTIGRRGHTITAWEDAEAPKQLLRGGTHKQAMDRFFGEVFASSGMTSVWVPSRIHRWIRCESCGQMINYDQAEAPGKCPCGAVLPGRYTSW